MRPVSPAPSSHMAAPLRDVAPSAVRCGATMERHRATALLSACVSTPLHPRTGAPRARYERDGEQPQHKDSTPDSTPDLGCWTPRRRLLLGHVVFSNEEYYQKLEELRRAHLHTMAELENMYLQKLEISCSVPAEEEEEDRGQRSASPLAGPRVGVRCLCGPNAPQRSLRRSQSAFELQRPEEEEEWAEPVRAAEPVQRAGVPPHVRNMWRDFRVSPPLRPQAPPRTTVPRPFQMTLREAERRRRGIKTRSEMEAEEAALLRERAELTECQRTFHASPIPAHVGRSLFRQMQERSLERRRAAAERHDQRLQRKSGEQSQQRPPQAAAQDRATPFRAKPVPRAVYAAAAGDLQKEAELYRSIKIRLRAQEMLLSAAGPPGMLEHRLGRRGAAKGGGASERFSHSPQINREVPDFPARHRRLQRHLERSREVRPITSCQPFDLHTARVCARRERPLVVETENGNGSPAPGRPARSAPGSSLCSSPSGSSERLRAKGTDATRQRHQAVRRVLEQRREAEEEEERRRDEQRRRERKLKRLVLRRAQANDPRGAPPRAPHGRLQEFRERELQRRKEYEQERREMERRVKGRPLLLEQVAQMSARQAAARRYADALRSRDLTEDFIIAQAADAAHADPAPGGDEEPPGFGGIFLDDGEDEVGADEDGGPLPEDSSDGGYNYSDDLQEDSEGGEHVMGDDGG